MRQLEVDEEINKVNNAYKKSIDIIKDRIKANKKLINAYQKELSGIVIKIDQIEKKIEKIKEDPENHIGKNLEYNLLSQKESQIDKLTIEAEELNDEKEIKDNAYKEIESLLRRENNEYENKLKDLENERDNIKKSIVNQSFYRNVIVIAANLNELREAERINNEMVNQNQDNLLD